MSIVTKITHDTKKDQLEEEIDRYGWFLHNRAFILELYGENHPVYIKMNTRDHDSWMRWFETKGINPNTVRYRDKKLRKIHGQSDD